MKKYLLFILGLFLMIPLTVKADMGAPAFTYKVRVTNPNGAKVYEYTTDEETGEPAKVYTINKTVPYDTVDEVTMEIKYKGKTYVSGGEYTLSEDDIEPLTDKIDLEKYKVSTLKLECIKEGAYLYNGPSYLFGKTKDNYMIPVGTTLEINYADELFGYVEYKGHKGWVYIYQLTESYSPYGIYGFFADVVDNSDAFYTTNKTKLYKNVSDKESAIEIPADTKLTYDLAYSISGNTNAYRVTYNGSKYWVKFYEIVLKVKSDQKLAIIKDTKIYKNIDAEKGPQDYTGKTIPKFTTLTAEYSTCYDYGSGCYYEINYNGTHGWIFDGEIENTKEDFYTFVETSHEYSSKYQLSKDITLYKNPDKKTEPKTVKEGTIVTFSGLAVYNDETKKFDYGTVYVVADDVEGFTSYDEKIFTYYGEEDPGEDDPNGKIMEDNHKKRLKNHKENKTNVIVNSIVCTVIVVVTAIISIIYINKKTKPRKLEKDESVQE